MKPVNRRVLYFVISALMSIISVIFVIWRLNYAGLSGKSMTSMAIDLMGIWLMTIEIGGCIPDSASDKKTVESFAHFLMVMAVLWFVDMFTWGIDGINTETAIVLAMVFDSLYCLCNLTSISAFTHYVKNVVHINKKRLRIYMIGLCVVFVLLAVLLILNIWLPIFFEIRDGVYYRLPPTNGLFVLVSLVLISSLFVFGETQIGRPEKIAIGAYVLLPLGFGALQLISYGFAFVPLAAVISTGVIYVHMYLHQNKIITEQHIQLQKNQTAVMLSQIQPHFLFNSLSTIVALCDLDPKLARQTTLDFSTYLERNLSSLTETEMVPFETELEQVNAYLRIEKARFGDYLNVERDLKVTNFRVPSLTVQPMVENAVKHGIQAMPEGGTVRISTYGTDNDWVVEIKDNGCGVDAHMKETEGFGIGINNTRTRLEAMCGGKLTITGEKGEGTTVTILIPKEK